jgi:hypothetical protein
MNIKDFDELQYKNNREQIAIDFDKVMHKSSKSFYDGTIYDEPIDGVDEALEKISRDYKIIIHTCKANPDRPLVDGKTGVELVWEWLKKYELHKYVTDIMYGKPNAKYYIDDKGIRFTSWSQTLKDIYE